MNIIYTLINHSEGIDFSSFIGPTTMENICRLIRNVNPSSLFPTEVTFQEFFKHGNVIVLANDDSSTVGMATLVYVSKINGVTARIEHVSVLSSHQGQGIAKKLVNMLIDDCRKAGRVRFIDLNSAPSRERANYLYQKLGFKLRNTNPYRFDIASAPE